MPNTHDFEAPIVYTDWDSKKRSSEIVPDGVIPMWIADTDFRCPQPVLDALSERLQAGILGYTVTSQRLRSAVKRWMKVRFGWEVEENWVRFSPGVIAGVTAAVRALTNPGDNLVLQTPCYTPFMRMARNNGRNLLRNPLRRTETGWEIDFADLEDKLRQPRTRMFILCNPQNPTGRVFTPEELREIGRLCRKYDITVISDEIHSDFVYSGHRHTPFASLSEEFAQHCITFINPSKTFNVAGLHTGAIIARSEQLLSRVEDILTAQKSISENVFGTLALCTAYEQCDYYADGIVRHLEGNIQMAVERVGAISGLSFQPPEGTYLFWLDCRAWGLSQEKLERFFLEKAKLRLSSGTEYGPEGEGYMRMNGACTRKTLEEAFRRIQTALAQPDAFHL